MKDEFINFNISCDRGNKLWKNFYTSNINLITNKEFSSAKFIDLFQETSFEYMDKLNMYLKEVFGSYDFTYIFYRMITQCNVKSNEIPIEDPYIQILNILEENNFKITYNIWMKMLLIVNNIK